MSRFFICSALFPLISTNCTSVSSFSYLPCIFYSYNYYMFYFVNASFSVFAIIYFKFSLVNYPLSSISPNIPDIQSLNFEAMLLLLVIIISCNPLLVISLRGFPRTFGAPLLGGSKFELFLYLCHMSGVVFYI
jgi:hypothetical protein